MNVRELRNCFGKFATGVTVVSWQGDDGQPHGITVNSFTSVSLEPPLVLVSIDRKAKSHDALKGRPFVINILAEEQASLAWQFAGKPQPDLLVEWEETLTGPQLKGVLAGIQCTPWRAYDGGDHTLYLGEVQDFSRRDGEGLIFFGGQFHKTNEMKSPVGGQI